MKKDTYLKFRISQEIKTKLAEIAKKNNTSISKILDLEIIKIIKKDNKIV